ncbi:MAG: GNAT family N-acetyltransferase, partial [Chloroflexi bacterium]|nr:GNAT family N-acetyltransferase [Chloroflexota bacterium]
GRYGNLPYNLRSQSAIANRQSAIVMKCHFCDEKAQYLTADTGQPVCLAHARLAVIAAPVAPSPATAAITIRAATAADRPEIERLALHFWDETEVVCFGQSYDVRQLPALVALVEDELAGALSYAVEGKRLIIVLLAVWPQHQRRGVGRRLVAAAVAEARRRGLGEVVVATSNDDLPALALYQRCGFQLYKVATGSIEQHHGGPLPGFAGLTIRDELRLRFPAR